MVRSGPSRRVSRGCAGRTGRLRRRALASHLHRLCLLGRPDTPPPLLARHPATWVYIGPSRQGPAVPSPVRHDTPPLVPSRQAPAAPSPLRHDDPASATNARMPSPSKSYGGERSGLGQAGASVGDKQGARGGCAEGPPPRVSLRRVDEAPLRGPPKRVGATIWPHRRADEAPLPRAAEGRQTRGIHQAAADEAPLSNAGAFFSTQHVPLVAGKKSFEPPFNFLCRRQVFPTRWASENHNPM